MWRHSGFSYFSNCNNDQWLLPTTKSPTPETVFMPSLALARCVSLCICSCVLCANCTQNWQPKQMGLNFIPWLCDDLILNSLSWASSVFPSPIVSQSSKGSWWDDELCLCIWALSVLPQEHTASRATYPLLGVCELEEEDGQEFRHQQEAGAPCCALQNKCQKTFKRILHSSLYCWVVKSTELKRSGLTYALFFAEGRISALSSVSCSSSAW